MKTWSKSYSDTSKVVKLNWIEYLWGALKANQETYYQ